MVRTQQNVMCWEGHIAILQVTRANADLDHSYKDELKINFSEKS